MTPFHPGDTVRLTNEFLRNTGQVVGGEGFSRWTIVACPCTLCGSGRFVATNEASYDDPAQARHFYAGNLEQKGTA